MVSFDLEGPNTPKGTPPLIGPMVKVESADVACKKVTSLGGRAKAAFDNMDQGRMAVCTDPNGAEFDVWEAKKLLGTRADSTVPGVPSWFETMTTDVERATTFYSRLFGWTPEVTPVLGSNYTTFKHGNGPVAGMLAITPQMGKQRPHWGTYFTVENADETARQAVDLRRQAPRGPRRHPGRRPLLRHHLTAGSYVLRHHVLALRRASKGRFRYL